MKEHMSEHQDYVDAGPSFKAASIDGMTVLYPPQTSGEVRIPKGDGIYVSRSAYSQAEANRVIRAGQLEPRRLSLREAQTATRNRARYALELNPYGRESARAHGMDGGDR